MTSREAAFRRHSAAGDAPAVERACDEAMVRGRIADLLVPAPWDLDGPLSPVGMPKLPELPQRKGGGKRRPRPVRLVVR